MKLRTNFKIIIYLYLLSLIILIWLRLSTMKQANNFFSQYNHMIQYLNTLIGRDELVYSVILQKDTVKDYIAILENLVHMYNDIKSDQTCIYLVNSNDMMKRKMSILDSLYKDLEQEIEVFKNNYPDNKLVKANSGEFIHKFLPLIYRIDLESKQVVAIFTDYTNKLQYKFMKVNTYFFIFIVFNFLIATLIAIYSILLLNKDIKSIGETAKDLDKINLYSEFRNVKTAEFRCISERLNRAMEVLREKILKSLKFVEQVHFITEGLNSSAQDVSKSAESEAKAAEKLTAIIEEFSLQLDNNLENVALSSQITDRFSKAVGEIKENIASISDYIRSIDERVGIITRIANKIDFLAIKTSIEAARAGASSEGFQVIADEIRSLANNTQQAAEQITGLIKIGVVHIEGVIQQSQQAFEDVDRLIQFIETVSLSFSEQAQIIDEIKSSIFEMSKSSQEHVELASNLVKTAEYLKKNSLYLKDMLKAFKEKRDDE